LRLETVFAVIRRHFSVVSGRWSAAVPTDVDTRLIVEAGTSNDPQKGYDLSRRANKADALKNRVRTVPDAPRRSCLTTKRGRLAGPSAVGRAPGQVLRSQRQLSAELQRATRARSLRRRRKEQSAPSPRSARACIRGRQQGGSRRVGPDQSWRPGGRPTLEVSREMRPDRARARVRAPARGLRGRRERARSAAPTAPGPCSLPARHRRRVFSRAQGLSAVWGRREAGLRTRARSRRQWRPKHYGLSARAIPLLRD